MFSSGPCFFFFFVNKFLPVASAVTCSVQCEVVLTKVCSEDSSVVQCGMVNSSPCFVGPLFSVVCAIPVSK